MDEREPIRDLQVWVHGGPVVQLARGGRWASTLAHRVDLKAEVDPVTGEVKFFVDPEDVDRLRP